MAASKENKPLEQWQKDDAKRLRKLFDAWKAEREHKGFKTSQREFGEDNEIGGQAAVWQYMSGEIALNVSAALKFAHGLGCRVAEFSPTISMKVAQATPTSAPTGEELNPVIERIISLCRIMSEENLNDLEQHAQWLLYKKEPVVPAPKRSKKGEPA